MIFFKNLPLNILLNSIFFLFLMHSAFPDTSISADTSKSVVIEFSGGVSFAVYNALNWKGVDANSLVLTTDPVYKYSLRKASSSQIFQVKLDLGFTYYYDSVWNKHADAIHAHYIYKGGNKPYSHTLSALFNTHLLKSYSYSYAPGTGKAIRQQTEKMFNPALLEMGFGSAYAFKNQSVVNVSLATARLKLLPDSVSAPAGENIPIGVFAGGFMYFDYGFSTQYYLLKKLGSKTELAWNGKLFLKGFHRTMFDMDISNILTVRLTKMMRLKAEIKLVYAPVISFKPQYHNEFLFGLFYNSVIK